MLVSWDRATRCHDGRNNASSDHYLGFGDHLGTDFQRSYYAFADEQQQLAAFQGLSKRVEIWIDLPLASDNFFAATLITKNVDDILGSKL